MSKAPRTIHDDGGAIDRYVAATFDRYRRTLVAQLPTFAEPRVADPTRALARIRLLVETLAGFAIGAAIGAVASAVRRGFGHEVRDGVGRVLGRVMLDAAPLPRVDAAPPAGPDDHQPRSGLRPAAPPDRLGIELTAPVPFLRDPARPLLDALGAQLHARLCAAVAEARAHVALVHAEITREAPARLRAFADTLELLAADDTSALSFADQLAAGWRCYAASVSDGAPDAAPDPKGTWQAWTSRLAGRAPAPELTQDQVVAEGFLMRIA